MGVNLVFSTNRRPSASEANSPGWKLAGNQWLWWDGQRYTHQAGADGTVQSTPPSAKTSNRSAMVGLILFAFTSLLWWVPGAATGPVIVVLGVIGRNQAKASGERTTFPTVVIVLGVVAFVFGLIMVAIVSSPDFEQTFSGTAVVPFGYRSTTEGTSEHV